MVLGLALAVLTGAALLASQSLDAGAAAPAGPAEVARGQYLVTLMGLRRLPYAGRAAGTAGSGPAPGRLQ